MHRMLQRLEEARLRLRVRTEGLWRALPPVLAVAAALMLAWRYLLDVGPLGRDVMFVTEQAIAITFGIRMAAVVLLAAHPLVALRQNALGAAIGAAALGILLADTLSGGPELAGGSAWQLASGALKVYLVATQGFELWSLGVSRFRITASLALALSFAALIGAGTGLLLDPRAVPPEKPLTAVDAVFTATSAVCVTGLVVRDTGSEFTPFGQRVILGLIQLGALGIMTFAAFFAASFGRGLGIRGQVLVSDMLQAQEIGQLPKMLAFILLSTVAIEAAGATAIYLLLDPAGAGAPGGRAWSAVFHAVSAFCNAGFGLHADSLARFEREPLLLAVFAALIVMGGIGYVVGYDLARWLLSALLRLFGRERRRSWRRPFSLQSRMVLVTSAVLIAIGAALLLVYEWAAPTYGPLDAPFRVANALFLSVSCRTAGFNIESIGAFSTGALFMMMALMFIGGSPGSTAGGVKTTTFAVLFGRIAGLLRHRDEIEMFGRTIPRRVIATAIGVVFIQFGLIFSITLALLFTDPRFPLERSLFEVVSAFGTVGLSTGITPELSAAGRVLITVAMFTGRIGPLTLIMAMAETSGRQPIYRYPDGKVMIG